MTVPKDQALHLFYRLTSGLDAFYNYRHVEQDSYLRSFLIETYVNFRPFKTKPNTTTLRSVSVALEKCTPGVVDELDALDKKYDKYFARPIDSLIVHIDPFASPLHRSHSKFIAQYGGADTQERIDAYRDAFDILVSLEVLPSSCQKEFTSKYRRLKNDNR